MLIRRIVVPVFNHTLTLLSDCEVGEMQSWCKRRYGSAPDVPAGFDGAYFEFCGERGEDLFVWFRLFDWTIVRQSCAVHELLHAVHAILSKVGVKDEEAEAYLLTWLMNRVWGLFRKSNPAWRKRKKNHGT